MGFRSIWVLVGGLVAVVTAIAFLKVAIQPGGPAQEQRDKQVDRDTLVQVPESGRPQSANTRVANEAHMLLPGQGAATDDGTASVDHLRSNHPANESALDHETGWPYATRIRAEQSLYEALDQPQVRGAAYMDQLTCGEGKCRFELGLAQPLSGDNAHLVSDFMADLDARLLAHEATSDVQVYLEKFSPRADGTGLSILTIDSRSEAPARVTVNAETGEATIEFPARPDGDD